MTSARPTRYIFPMTLAFDVPGSADGWLRRLDARWKLAAIGVAVVALATLATPAPALAAAALAFAVVVSGGTPPRAIARRVLPVLLMIALFFAWGIFLPRPSETSWLVLGFEISPSRLRTLVTLLAKTAAFLILVAALLQSTDLPELGQAARRIGVPKILVLLFLLTQRYVFVLADEFLRLRRALRVRGYQSRMDRRTFALIGMVAGVLFVRGHERAERVAQAMAARGFDGSFHSLAESRTSRLDLAAFAAIALASGLFLAWDRGWLRV